MNESDSTRLDYIYGLLLLIRDKKDINFSICLLSASLCQFDDYRALHRRPAFSSVFHSLFPSLDLSLRFCICVLLLENSLGWLVFFSVLHVHTRVATCNSYFLGFRLNGLRLSVVRH